MEALFSYGTLQIDAVQKETFGRHIKGTKDVLMGYVLSEVSITSLDVIKTSGKSKHPILIKTGDLSDEVDGTVFYITQDELHQADKYEVDDYARTKAHVKSGKQVWVYAQATALKQTT